MGQQVIESLPIIDTAVFFEAMRDALGHLFVGPARQGDANDRNVECALLGHGIEGWEQLLVGQVASRSKQHECIGLLLGFRNHYCRLVHVRVG